jgi:MFS superfamily sulfate permease-like transporter
MTDQTSLTQATRKELENARTKGQVVGWLQGAGVMLVVGLALKLAGFLPLVLIGAVIAYIAYRLLSGRGKRSPGG